MARDEFYFYILTYKTFTSDLLTLYLGMMSPMGYLKMK